MTYMRNMSGNQQQMKPTKQYCKQLMNYHVMGTMEDGSSFDGIVMDANDNEVTMLMGEDVMVDENGNEENESRQWGYGGYGGFGRRRARRFRRRVLPLAGLTSLLLYPYFAPYPYYPYYPYY
ncbi:hypothetical protein [Halobacillus campisalis]|uniref:Uncharacterized protein n=1 Tax=Halobacillus campisalis TaxID=435909 RepID=A0ABW2K5W6_9BACI|nr:hypothetical protein [Halobacillus campisalis]